MIIYRVFISFFHLISFYTVWNMFLCRLLVELPTTTTTLQPIILNNNAWYCILTIVLFGHNSSFSQLGTLLHPLGYFRFFFHFYILSLHIFSLFIHHFYFKYLSLFFDLLTYLNMFFKGLWLEFSATIQRTLDQLYLLILFLSFNGHRVYFYRFLNLSGFRFGILHLSIFYRDLSYLFSLLYFRLLDNPLFLSLKSCISFLKIVLIRHIIINYIRIVAL